VAVLSVLIESINNYIIQPINNVIDVINTIPGVSINHIPDIPNGFDGNAETTLLQEWRNFRDVINEILIGCGRKHPSPFVRSYIKNVCDKCGVTFKSSIYNDPNSEYYNTMYMNAQIKKGTRDDNVKMIGDNVPIKTLDMFLDDLALVVNARWELKNGEITFERKDYFYNGDIWINFETEDNIGTIEGELCLEWREEMRPSYGDFQYSPDPVDLVGNEALDRYNDIVEWNLPYSELQEGHQDIILPFGPSRFRADGIDEDILGKYQNAPFGLGDTINDHQFVMSIEKGVAFLPKLLIWDGVDMNFARIKRYNVPGFEVGFGENFNFPYFFNEHNNVAPPGIAPTNQPQAGVYVRFYSIDNPKLFVDTGKSFTFTIRYNCSNLTTALSAQYVGTPYGNGRIKRMQINPSSKTILVSGDL
jgi:hypothetical protein